MRAVDGVSFEVNKNEIYGIAGESGCGKSTLLKAVSGLVKPPLQILDGEVSYNFSDESLNILSSTMIGRGAGLGECASP